MTLEESWYQRNFIVIYLIINISWRFNKKYKHIYGIYFYFIYISQNRPMYLRILYKGYVVQIIFLQIKGWEKELYFTISLEKIDFLRGCFLT